MPTTDWDSTTRTYVNGRVTGTDPVGAPVVDSYGHEARWRLTLGALETGARAGEVGMWLTTTQGAIALDEIDVLIADLGAMQSAAEAYRDQQLIHEQLDRIEDCEQRLDAEGLAEWMDATGTTVADYLDDNRNALNLDEDDATEMGPAEFRLLVDALDAAVEAIETEAIDNPLAPHPSSPRSAEQRDFRAAVGF